MLANNQRLASLPAYGLKKCIFFLLDCFTSFAMTAFCITALVRNEGKDVMNYGSINSRMASGSIKRGFRNARHCEKAKPAWQSRTPSSLRGGVADAVIQNVLAIARRRSRRGNPEYLVIARKRSRRGNPDGLNECIFSCWIASLRSQ
jgi:hypothetical protein